MTAVLLSFPKPVPANLSRAPKNHDAVVVSLDEWRHRTQLYRTSHGVHFVSFRDAEPVSAIEAPYLA